MALNKPGMVASETLAGVRLDADQIAHTDLRTNGDITARDAVATMDREMRRASLRIMKKAGLRTLHRGRGRPSLVLSCVNAKPQYVTLTADT